MSSSVKECSQYHPKQTITQKEILSTTQLDEESFWRDTSY